MRRTRLLRVAAFALATASPSLATEGALAQEPDTARVQEDTTAIRDSALVADSALLTRPRPQRCVLQWEPLAPDTEGLSLREGGEAHITHVSGRMLWTCGTARMEADSAVKYDRARRVDLIGNVVYRDTTRTLRSRFLTYFELPDLVIATGEVELERVADGSTLEGPRVEFLRAVSGVDELTIATGRPHMRLYPEGEERTNPFEIDADRTVFAGEEEARVYGDVIIRRDDLDAAADSAYLRRIDETGVLWGSPWVDAEGVRLSGDTIRFASEDDELREVHALGNGHAIGESFEVRAERIDVELVDREVETVWAHGPGGSEAVSGSHHVYGDSLRFAMFAGSIDTLYAAGETAAIQAEGPVALARLDPREGPSEGGDSTAVSGDSAAAADSTVVPVDSLAVTGDSSTVSGDSSAVVGDPAVTPPDSSVAPPDTSAAAPADSAAAPPGDTAAVTGDSTVVPPDSTVVPPDSTAAPSDSTAAPSDSTTAPSDPIAAPSDSTAAPPDSVETGPDATGRDTGSIRPEPSVDGRSNWVRGDTLIAIFERDASAGVSTDSGPHPVADSLADPSAGDPALVLPPADSLAMFPVPPTPAPAAADTASDPRMERLIVIGNASSFYRQVRDTARTARPSRNYMIGKRIDVLFEDGEPETVKGTDAIGIYLEPEEGVAGEEGPPADTGRAVPDSLVVRDSALVLPDSLRPDSTASPPDSAAAPPDSVTASPASTIARPGSAGRAIGSLASPTAAGRPSHGFRLRRRRP